LGTEVDAASVAHGYYSPKVASSAAAAGIKALFNSEPTTRVDNRDGCLVHGRYSVQSGMTADECAAIACGHLLSRLRQAVWWQAKKVAKRIGGELYLSARDRILSPADSSQKT
jgi:hypothetical protein